MKKISLSTDRHEIAPDEIFLDSQNLPEFDLQQFEGRLEQPIAKQAVWGVGIFCILAGVLLVSRIAFLQIDKGDQYRARSENNRLQYTPYFANRGIITDRRGVLLAWNAPDRVYTTELGVSHLLGYVGYPTEQEAAGGAYHPGELVGKAGVEQAFEPELHGKNGLKIVEANVRGAIISESVYQPPVVGSTQTLSIDARVQNALHNTLSSVVRDRGFVGGAGVIMEVNTGKLLAITNYPEYDLRLLSGGGDERALRAFTEDSRKPFLNRAVAGLYAPGSIVKPFVALGALEAGVIDPKKEIVSTGSLTVTNPYDPKKPSVFLDWKAHGAVDMRRALAVSSDVYFYEVGGGWGSQQGLGIARLEQFMKKFGFGTTTGIELAHEPMGVIPSPAWKERVFPGDPWRIGDTYHTVIGQYGFSVTPLQVARAIGALANGGFLYTPTIRDDARAGSFTRIPLAPANLAVVQEGMRQAVLSGTASGLALSNVAVAAKTGTAELGVTKQKVNSWVTGYFPYDHPRYAFAVVLERGDRHNTIGGVFVMRQLFDWMAQNAPEYIRKL